jgi:glycine hydroxymethyltransferase
MKKINSAIFPGLQGGPMMHTIAAKAVAFQEALGDEFKVYVDSLCANCKTLEVELKKHGFDLVSGGTDNHLLLVDVRNFKVTGNIAEKALERVGLTCNKNSIPNDPEKPTVTSGIRIGTAAATSRGLGKDDFVLVAKYMAETLACQNSADREMIESQIRQKVLDICKKYPIYQS